MNRRTFLRRAAVAGTVGVGLAGRRPGHALAEPPPETTRLRLFRSPSLCVTPQFVAEELLRAEGFTDVQYVEGPGVVSAERLLAAGEIDINSQYSAPLIIRIDAGEPVAFLSGLHIGCFELFGTERVRGIRDLKGKTVAVLELGSVQHVFVASMAAYVGLDPRRDIQFVTPPPTEAKRLLAAGKIDAFLGFPPDPQELRAKKIGHVVVSSTLDRPWSQYFCCMIAGNREFVRFHPVATKRAVRALLKANQICALEPERAARIAVDRAARLDPNRSTSEQFEYTLQTVKEIPYAKWRDYDPEDTLRFYALRLHEVGMIKSSPQKILAQGTDWRFLNELKKELKG
jgi:NitT/TauT family transport system substrate-binding protein